MNLRMVIVSNRRWLLNLMCWPFRLFVLMLVAGVRSPMDKQNIYIMDWHLQREPERGRGEEWKLIVNIVSFDFMKFRRLVCVESIIIINGITAQ